MLSTPFHAPLPHTHLDKEHVGVLAQFQPLTYPLFSRPPTQQDGLYFPPTHTHLGEEHVGVLAQLCRVPCEQVCEALQRVLARLLAVVPRLLQQVLKGRRYGKGRERGGARMRDERCKQAQGFAKQQLKGREVCS